MRNWEIIGEFGQKFNDEPDQHSFVGNLVITHPGNVPINQIESDVKLIASAPELLEALINIVDAQTNPAKSLAYLNGAINKSMIAIKKATE